jgi:hypothetical protein
MTFSAMAVCLVAAAGSAAFSLCFTTTGATAFSLCITAAGAAAAAFVFAFGFACLGVAIAALGAFTADHYAGNECCTEQGFETVLHCSFSRKEVVRVRSPNPVLAYAGVLGAFIFALIVRGVNSNRLF